MTADGERGWVCSERTEHFIRAVERSASEPVVSTTGQANWDDDGGPMQEEKKEAAVAAAG